MSFCNRLIDGSGLCEDSGACWVGDSLPCLCVCACLCVYIHNLYLYLYKVGQLVHLVEFMSWDLICQIFFFNLKPTFCHFQRISFLFVTFPSVSFVIWKSLSCCPFIMSEAA